MKGILLCTTNEIIFLDICIEGGGSVDGGKNPSQQRGSLPVSQVPIRLTNVWYGRSDGIMDPLPSRG